MPCIKAPSQSILQPLHTLTQVRFWGFNKKMVVIAQQDPGMDAPTRHRTRLTQRLEEKRSVRLVTKNGFAAIASGHDMVKGPGELDADAARHALLSPLIALQSRFDA
jgi:hypothetical protein